MIVHVHPLNDEREHEASSSCWCGPRVDTLYGSLRVIHNSADHREIVEAATGEGWEGKPWALEFEE